MARPSNRTQRRRAIARALEEVLAVHGLGGATIAAVADEAGCAPGLIHHHFEDRQDLMRELVRSLMARFREQLPATKNPDEAIDAYIDAAVAIDPRRGRSAARAWVGLFAEAIQSASVLATVRSSLNTELVRLERLFVERGEAPEEAKQNAAGVLAGIVGCLVLGALVPDAARGFAAPYLKRTRPR